MKIWLIGAGIMAQDYAKVLLSLGTSFKVIGRRESSAKNFTENLGKAVQIGGVKNALTTLKAPDVAIIAVGVADLAETAITLINAGTKRILVEKPGGIDLKEIDYLNRIAIDHKVSVYLGYNRRFYASSIKARELILEDGGLTSARFEFTEWSHIIGALDTDSNIKNRWVLANSSHVMDLAFHFSGLPIKYKSVYSGSLNWHLSAARFCGSGITKNNIIFSYFADWESAGRWSLELFTRARRIILSPMEKIQIMKVGSIKIETINLNDSLDIEFKPGLYKQTKAFLSGENSNLCTLENHVEAARVYNKIAGYK
jgi:predicted dehydrogenase